ncbi:ATP-dependent dethiobiotin synthetase BioD [Buchnera aphidicola (Hyadaphis tataricae)]|uniref:ATP-dependent dethiobiotin synthetase BioD n=1 Tax=Buchnera aphidicola (Hyadaphis tataricae) TaxID=1241859 RepID=A0A4D6Y6N0_9GAMM|nr:dethiobiotin synthase [Buchnera aphidicola]QCI21590.1 ATP-dependent dethiobiotin synthetase BioD [Buchnera aphidicola (Hyadaphis tataricae)]
MSKKFFITGTDTNVGKTFVSTILLKKATQYGYKTAGYKPVSSGLQKMSSHVINTDAFFLKKNSSVILSDTEVNPITFFENAPPHILSQMCNKNINIKDLSLGLKNMMHKSNWILIEGAGGWYTPLSYKNTFADWVQKERLTVIIIVGIKLGCINHAILTEQAIFSKKLKCKGWIANNVVPEDRYNLYYIQTLLKYLRSPLLGIVPYISKKSHINLENIYIQLPD